LRNAWDSGTQKLHLQQSKWASGSRKLCEERNTDFEFTAFTESYWSWEIFRSRKTKFGFLNFRKKAHVLNLLKRVKVIKAISVTGHGGL
jgi:hypothetical protein